MMMKLPKIRRSPVPVRVLVLGAFFALVVSFIGYGLAAVGGSYATKDAPFQWNSDDRNLVVVFDESGDTVGCIVDPENGEKFQIDAPRRTVFDMKVADAQASFSGSAEVACGDARIFTGFPAFMVNFRTSFICPAIVLLLVATGIYRRSSSRDEAAKRRG